MKKVADDKPILYHYTTGAGLAGIISEQRIRATSIRYLNDAEEQIGYLKGRLPILLKKWAHDTLLALEREPTPAIRVSLAIAEKANRVAESLSASIIEMSGKVDDPYVASFSAPPEHCPEDGLLSQWRAYGSDGGYAIVFDTAGFDRLLELEFASIHHQTLMIGDVEYYNDATHICSRLPETDEDEAKIKEALRNFLLTGGRGALDSMYTPLLSLSVRSKNHGFREEMEVRIVAVRSVASVRELEIADGETRPQREIDFRLQDGLLIPYINLFGTDKLGKEAKLPIKQIIVGPHPDKDKRRGSVEKLLERYGIQANVSVSSIPYLPS